MSTHVLDTAIGRPACDVVIVLSREIASGWEQVGSGTTDRDGRCRTLLGEASLVTGVFKLHFAVADYYATHALSGLYPFVEIVFTVTDPEQHYHIPLLLTANGYTTYRGS